ncbi:MAG TPA: HK97 family phage prohead protease [Flavobacterium sp.]|nr:HK97 family phage prohead protease [Flavobacterium sp.]
MEQTLLKKRTKQAQTLKMMNSKKLSLSERIEKLKTRAGFVQYAAIDVQEANIIEKSDFKKRIIRGYLCKWGHKNQFGEKLVKGSCAKSISEKGPESQAKYKITFLWQHDMCDPLSLFAILKEDDYGLYFETAPLDNVPSANRALEQIESGTLNQFSLGFYYIWDKIQYDDSDDSLVLLEIDVVEGSVVTAGADSETYAIRSGHKSAIQLFDEIERFIDTLPRKDRFQARQLFTQQKALVQFEKRATKLKRGKPPMKKRKGIDIKILTKNL